MFSTNLAEKALRAMNSRGQADDLLQTPQSRLRSPLLIESAILGDTFYLVANEAQAGEVERVGGVCYLPREIKILLLNSEGMDEEALKGYLGKVHAVKKTFPRATIHGGSFQFVEEAK